jgi:aminopeptidase N
MTLPRGFGAFLLVLVGSHAQASPATDATWLRRDVLHRLEWAGAPPASEVRPPSPNEVSTHGFDVLHYEIQLTPNLAAQTLAGTTSITLESTTSGLTSVGLHLHTLTVSGVLLDSVPLSFTHVGEALSITLDRPYAVGETLTVRVTYSGTPDHESFGGFFFFSDMAFSMGVGLSTQPPSMGRYWFPCFDEPHDKATVTFRVTVPTGRKVVANGLLTSVTSGPGGVTYQWDETHVTSTYLMAVAIADWRIVLDPVDPSRIYHYVLPGDSVNAVTSFQNVSLMMEAFESHYSPYHYDKFSYVGVRRGDMEHSTCVAHLRTLINGTNFYDPILAHELAHHWWGDWVTVADWRDVWLSEGFATYSEAIYAEHLGGAAGYHDYVDGDILDFYLQSGETFPIYDPAFLWGATVYEKGAAVLHMLRHVVGDATFFETLQAWGSSFGFANAVTTDFIATAEGVAAQELDWFFDEWVYGAGYPAFEWGWTTEPSGSDHVVQVVVDQVQTTGSTFTMPVDVRITTVAGATTVTGMVDELNETLTFLVPDAPIDVELDPDRWVLCEKTEVSVGVGSNGGGTRPLALSVSLSNPFSPATAMRVSGLDGSRPAVVRIFDPAGRTVRLLVDGHVNGGTAVLLWDGRDEGGLRLPPGLYFLRASQDASEVTKRIVLLW